MELIGNESGNAPRRYSMDMSKDVIPMSVFSESTQGDIHLNSYFPFKIYAVTMLVLSTSQLSRNVTANWCYCIITSPFILFLL